MVLRLRSISMKFNIYINQYKLTENNEVTIQDCAVIDWLYSMFGSSSEKITKKREEGWTWISLTHLIEDMPLLRIKTNSGASKLLNRIKNFGYIETRVDKKERKLYAKPTKKIRDLYFSNRVRKDVSQVPQETSQVLQDPNHNTIINTLNTIPVATAKVEVKKTKKQIREESPFIFKEELESLWNSGWKPKKIIYNYFVRKNIVHENVKQFDSAVARYLRPAQALEGYSSKQIESVMDYLDSKKLSWTLETIAKNISEVVNRK